MASRQELLTQASALKIIISDFTGFVTDGYWLIGWMDKRMDGLKAQSMDQWAGGQTFS